MLKPMKSLKEQLLERLAVFGCHCLLTPQEIQDMLSKHHVELNISSTYEKYTHAVGTFAPFCGKEERYNGRGGDLTLAMNEMLLTYLLYNQPCQVLRVCSGKLTIDKGSRK